MRSEQAIEDKIDKALKEKAQPNSPASHEYLRGAREALGWVIEEDDAIPGVDEE